MPIHAITPCPASVNPAVLAGLVSSSTSPTNLSEQSSAVPSPGTVFQLDPSQARVKRLRRTVLTAARTIQDELTSSGVSFRCAFITATYAPDSVWSPGDISRLVDNYTKWAARRNYPIHIVWVAELGSKSGRFHYHLMLWLPRGVTPPKPDKQGWWKHGYTNCKWAKSPVGYLAKYAGKGSDSAPGVIPKGARLHGVIGLRGEAFIRWRWALLPKWVRALSPDPLPAKRMPSGAYRVGAIEIRSPWEFVRFAAGALELRWRGWSPSRFFPSRSKGGASREEWDIRVCGYAI
jgi:hypothetical protein